MDNIINKIGFYCFQELYTNEHKKKKTEYFLLVSNRQEKPWWITKIFDHDPPKLDCRNKDDDHDHD